MFSCVEVVPTGLHAPEKSGVVAGVQRCLHDAVSSQLLKTVIAIAQVDEVWIGVAEFFVVGALASLEALCVGRV